MTAEASAQSEPKPRKRGPSAAVIRHVIAAGGELRLRDGTIIRPAGKPEEPGGQSNSWDSVLET